MTENPMAWFKEANQWMNIARKDLSNDCLSSAASALAHAERLIPTDKLTKRSDAAWKRFSVLNDKLCRKYAI